jgi:hypothetical protein
MYNELSYPHLVGGCGMDAISMQTKNLMNFFWKSLSHIFRVKLQLIFV